MKMKKGKKEKKNEIKKERMNEELKRTSFAVGRKHVNLCDSGDGEAEAVHGQRV